MFTFSDKQTYVEDFFKLSPFYNFLLHLLPTLIIFLSLFLTSSPFLHCNHNTVQVTGNKSDSPTTNHVPQFLLNHVWKLLWSYILQTKYLWLTPNCTLTNFLLSKPIQKSILNLQIPPIWLKFMLMWLFLESGSTSLHKFHSKALK